jgi:hypothetical protein
MNESEVPGARNLFYWKIGELSWAVLNLLFWQVGMRLFGLGDHMLWLRVSGILGALLTLTGFVLLIPFSQGRRGTPSEPLAQGAVVLTGLVLLFDVVGVLPGAERLLLARSTVTTLTPLFFGVLAGSGMFSLAAAVLPFETYRRLFFESSFSSLLSWAHTGCSFATTGLFILLLSQLLRSGGPAGATTQPADAAAPSAARDIWSGVVLLVLGIASTLLSYSAASGGGRYFVATGAVAWGLVRLIRGLTRLTS